MGYLKHWNFWKVTRPLDQAYFQEIVLKTFKNRKHSGFAVCTAMITVSDRESKIYYYSPQA